MKPLYTCTITDVEGVVRTPRQLFQMAANGAAKQNEFEQQCGGAPWPPYIVHISMISESKYWVVVTTTGDEV